MVNAILVEDDLDLRASLVDALSSAGHDVVGVGSAVELYQRLAASQFDAAILDVNLPHYDGLSIASYLSEKTDMAIVMITGRGASEDRVKGYLSGCDLYLVKPVDCEELSAALDSLVRKRRGRAANTPAEGGWQLDRSAFRLSAPAGARVLLTRREAQLLETLTKTPGAIVARGEILGLLGYDGEDTESRALDAAISRLRAKVQAECGSPLPLQTVQGVGFVFSGAIRLVGQIRDD